jgi:hypothetical protein
MIEEVFSVINLSGKRVFLLFTSQLNVNLFSYTNFVFI